MTGRLCILGSLLAGTGLGCTGMEQGFRSNPLLVAHRGASAYAPEHTLAAYRLALEQGADLVEQDLQVTRDGRLVCLHDETLQRTTDVESVFPDRYRLTEGPLGASRQWYVRDFDLSEVRQLDAGSWFAPEFAGETIPTFSEAIKLIRGQAGLFPELKAPGAHREEGLDMVPLVVGELKSAGLFQPGANPGTPVFLQSFDGDSLRRLRDEFDCRLPLVLLISRSHPELMRPEALREIAVFSDAIGPDKVLLRNNPPLVEQAHQLGLQLFPYTFSMSRLDPEFGNLTAEMHFYLSVLRVDGLFTDNPDLFPRPRAQ